MSELPDIDAALRLDFAPSTKLVDAVDAVDVERLDNDRGA